MRIELEIMLVDESRNSNKCKDFQETSVKGFFSIV